MPRYFFNVRHDGLQRDRDGHDLPDHHAAWKEATITAGQVLEGIDGSLKPGHDWEMEITDEFSNVLYRLQISAHKPAN